MADEYEPLDRNEQPCPVGNRWGPEIDRLNVEIRSLRHRASNTEQIATLQGAVMKTMDEDLATVKKTLYGNGQPGLCLDVDRLKQRSLGMREMTLLVIAAVGGIGGGVGGIAALIAVWK